MQRRGVIEPVAPIDVEAACQQQLDAGDMPAAGGVMQQRPVPGAAGDIDLAGMLAEQPRESSASPVAAAATILPARLTVSTWPFNARQLL